MFNAGLLGDAISWRRELHMMPELLYDLDNTADYVADKLRSFGCDEVVTGIARSGVVATIVGSLGEGPSVGLRADMDALPIEELANVPYRSQNPGKMHACGHDGHMAMLLGATRQLCVERDFRGRVVLIFQPAEEGGAGARAMIEDGLFDRFPVDCIFGMHNMPGMPVGTFAIRTGALMAAADDFKLKVEGRGGHGALPHLTVDPILITGHLITALQSLVSRNTDPLDAAVLSITSLRSGEGGSVLPDDAWLTGIVRTLNEATQNRFEETLRERAQSIAASFGGRAELSYVRNYPVLQNSEKEVEAALAAARIAAIDPQSVDADTRPVMIAEDFAFMLQKRPGAFIFMGNGASQSLHHPRYVFDDEAIRYGVRYWTGLVDHLLG